MTAAEAKELMNGSMNYKGIWYRARLAWICGTINKKIEYYAEHGYNKTEIRKNKNFAEIYYPMLAKLYEKNGFLVCYDTYLEYYNSFYIIWDFSKIPDWWKEKYYNKFNYHTITEEERKLNESDCSSGGDR